MLDFFLSKEFCLNSGYSAFYTVVLLNALTKYQEDSSDLVSHRCGDGNSFCSMLYSCEEFSLLSEARKGATEPSHMNIRLQLTWDGEICWKLLQNAAKKH